MQVPRGLDLGHLASTIKSSTIKRARNYAVLVLADTIKRTFVILLNRRPKRRLRPKIPRRSVADEIRPYKLRAEHNCGRRSYCFFRISYVHTCFINLVFRRVLASFCRVWFVVLLLARKSQTWRDGIDVSLSLNLKSRSCFCRGFFGWFVAHETRVIVEDVRIKCVKILKFAVISTAHIKLPKMILLQLLLPPHHSSAGDVLLIYLFRNLRPAFRGNRNSGRVNLTGE